MATKREENLDSKSLLVNPDKLRILNSEDSDDSELISYENLKASLENDGIGGGGEASTFDPAGNYTILDNDGYTHIINSATGTITLPTLSANYNRIITIIRDVADSTTALIIDGEGAETISGETEQYIYGQYGVISLIASEDAGEWVYVGKPHDPYNIFTEILADVNRSGITSGTWYNVGGLDITLLPGKWEVGYSVTSWVSGISPSGATNLKIQCTLSTGSGTESDVGWTSENTAEAQILRYLACTLSKTSEQPISVSSNTIYYINLKGTFGGSISTSFLIAKGTTSRSYIWARRVF